VFVDDIEHPFLSLWLPVGKNVPRL
jgi:hypothetical protein